MSMRPAPTAVCSKGIPESRLQDLTCSQNLRFDATGERRQSDPRFLPVTIVRSCACLKGRGISMVKP